MAEAIDVPAARNQVFNIGADQPYSVKELARAVAQAMGVEAQLVHLPARNEVQDAYSAHGKIGEVFGERPPVPLEIGLARMAAWVRQHGARASQEFDLIEVRKNFPLAWLPAGTVEA
jgi:UDP-glucose 4-epimerase